jgi:hypothetical protein
MDKMAKGQDALLVAGSARVNSPEHRDSLPKQKRVSLIRGWTWGCSTLEPWNLIRRMVMWSNKLWPHLVWWGQVQREKVALMAIRRVGALG